MGMPVPANEVAERAERIRVGARGRRRVPVRRARPSTARRRSPRSTTRASSASSRSPGPRSGRQGIDRPFLSADTYPNRAMFEGMSRGAVAGLVREPVQAGGRAGFWGLDSAAPLVAGTYAAARAAVDVALTTVDLVLGGRDGGLRAVPAARPSRRALDVRRVLLLQQRRDRGRGHRPGDRRAGRDPRRRLPPRQRQPADLLAPRRRPLRVDPRRPGPRLPVLPGSCRRDRRGRRGGGEPQHPAARRARPTRTTSRRSDRALEAIAGVPGSIVVVSLGFDTYGLDPIGDFRADDRRLPRGRPADGGRSAAGWSSSRRAATTGRRSARTPGPGCAAPRAGRSIRCRRPASGAWHGRGLAVRRPVTAAATGPRRTADASHARPSASSRRAIRTSAAIVARYRAAAAVGPRARLSRRCSTSSSSSRSRSRRPARRSIAFVPRPTR